jgi:acetyl-CoA acetyltransferase
LTELNEAFAAQAGGRAGSTSIRRRSIRSAARSRRAPARRDGAVPATITHGLKRRGQVRLVTMCVGTGMVQPFVT